MNVLALLSNNRWWKFNSIIVKFILVLFYQFKIGKNFYCEGVPKLRLKGKKNISIGDNVKILGNIDLRTRENGKIVIGDNVKIEENCRFVAAREGKILIGDGCTIGSNAIWNGGGDILVAEDCIFSARSSINANEHQMNKNIKIKDQGFNYGDVRILSDCFFGINISINKNITINQGAIVGANSFVNKNLEEFTINAGSPVKKIKDRI